MSEVPFSGLHDPLGDVIDTELLQLLGRQRGVVARSQLCDQLGWSSSRLWRARRQGLLIDMTPTVMRLASAPESWSTRCMALHLHLDGCGFISSTTAAKIYGLRSMPESPIRATVPETTRRRCPLWAEVSHSSWFDELDRCRLDDGLIVATPMRMLFGLAATLPPYRFARAAEDAWNLDLITPEQAGEYLEAHRCRGKDGVAVLEQWVETVGHQDRPAQSGLEQLLIECLVRVGLPNPVRQHPLMVAGTLIHLDIAWPDVKLAVEPGSGWWHGGTLRQRRDHARDRGCSELGWHVVRFDESLRDDPMAAARQVQRIHAARSSRNSA